MLNRWIGIGVVLAMLAGNTSLFVRDILPRWTAGDPRGRTPGRGQPALRAPADRHLRRPRPLHRPQLDTDSDAGRYVSVSSTTLLNSIDLPDGLHTPKVRVDSELRYTGPDQVLDELTISLHGLPLTVMLRGELMPPDQFACRWQAGREQGVFVLDARLTRAFGDVLRPFMRLPGLYVGQTWRLQLMNPLSQVMPGFSSQVLVQEPEIVRVTGTEVIEHAGRLWRPLSSRPRDCGRGGAGRNGAAPGSRTPAVARQLTLRDEPFDEQAYNRAHTWRAEARDGVLLAKAGANLGGSP